ncbi:MAG: beta-galactosidase, partial [Phycisphaerae bacterium]
MALLLTGLLVAAADGRADEPVVTTLADYEDDSVAARIVDVENVLAADCDVRTAAIPARGQRSLVVDIGATEPDAAATCDLRFRVATPFDQANRVAAYAWIMQGAVTILFRVRDAAGSIFETSPITLSTPNRWMRLAADLAPNELKLVERGASADDSAASRLTWPIQIRGYRIRAHGIGRQTVYLDDLEVEHRASGPAVLRGEFELDKAGHIYEPGALIRAAVVLENISRRRALPLTVLLAWLRADGTELTSARAPINLPPSGADFRSRRAVDFSQRIDEPGLYQLVARVRGPRWITPAVFETTIAVAHTNRALPRGRATFFGVGTNLMREPLADQLLEIDIAHEIGVQLLAIETPWRAIEPSPGALDFEALDEVIDLITPRDIATMIILTERPEWLATDGVGPWRRQAMLFEALARRYGKRICAYQPLPADPAKPGRLTAADLTAVEQIRRRVAEIRPDADVLAPPLVVQANDTDRFSLPSAGKVQLTFETGGDPAAAATTLETFATQNKLKWSQAHRWFHRAEALNGSGAFYDAVALLRHYVRAARAGVGGVVWFDLRDDTNDPRRSERMNGLAQRDFSPKTPLLGFANAVGMLHGLLYAGEVFGTPAEFDSALFIGGQRQVAVLFPKPNRVLPAVLAPYQTVPGELTVFDFDRRERPLTYSAATPLVATLPKPFFIALHAQRAQAAPKVGLARPWWRAPATVYCGKETTFRIEIDAPINLRRSYLQVILPAGAPVKSSLSSRALRAKAGDTLSFDVKLTRTRDKLFAPTDLIVRARLEDDTLQFPVTLRPLVQIRRMKPTAKITDTTFVIGRLTPPNSDDDTEAAQVGGTLYAGYQDRKLHLAIALPPDAGPDAVVNLGIAVENADTHAEVHIADLLRRPKLSPAYATSPVQVRAWRCRVSAAKHTPARFCRVSIPAVSLGLSAFQPATRLLLAARYAEPAAGSQVLPLVLEWGSG